MKEFYKLFLTVFIFDYGVYRARVGEGKFGLVFSSCLLQGEHLDEHTDEHTGVLDGTKKIQCFVFDN